MEKYKSIGQNQPLALAINQFFLLWEQLDKLPLLARKFLISSMSLFLFAKNKTNSSFLDSSIFSAFFCGTNIQIQCSSWHKKLQLFFGLLTRTNQTNLVSLGLFCLAGNTWTKIQCPFEGKDKLCLDWHKKLQLLFGFLFMRFLCHFCLARKIRQTWPLTFGRKKLDVLLTENN